MFPSLLTCYTGTFDLRYKYEGHRRCLARLNDLEVISQLSVVRSILRSIYSIVTRIDSIENTDVTQIQPLSSRSLSLVKHKNSFPTTIYNFSYGYTQNPTSMVTPTKPKQWKPKPAAEVVPSLFAASASSKPLKIVKTATPKTTMS
jgi:hypothetical protein